MHKEKEAQGTKKMHTMYEQSLNIAGKHLCNGESPKHQSTLDAHTHIQILMKAPLQLYM